MKVLLLIFSIIAVFSGDCHVFVNTSEAGGSSGESQKFPEVPKGHNSAKEDHHLIERSLLVANGTEGAETADEDQLLMKGMSPSKQQLRKSRCKARNACVVMGGFCVTNATLCSGRLVAEGCKGTNCQCCVPGTLEIKIQELENELETMKNSLNASNSEMNNGFHTINSNISDSIREHQGSLEIKTNNIGQELKSITNDLTRLKDLPSAIENITHTDSDLQQELQNITLINSELKMELDFMKSNITKSNSKMDAKLDLILKRQGCYSNGLFLFSQSNQCFKFLKDKTRTWQEADTRCRLEGLILAKPANPIAIRSYLRTKLGATVHTFIGARGDGRSFKWQRDGQTISNSDPNWWPGKPGRYITTDRCLALVTNQDVNPVYYPDSCASSRWTLCELVCD